MLVLINGLKTLQVQRLQRNNAGENQAFEWTCNQEWLGIEFEYTAPGTPQQNGHVEWKFATFFKRVHAMLNGGKFSSYLWSGLWAEAAMILKIHLITPKRTLSSYQQIFGRGKSNVLKIWWNVHHYLQGRYSLGLISQLRNSQNLGRLCQKPSLRYITDLQPQNEVHYFDPGCDFP